MISGKNGRMTKSSFQYKVNVNATKYWIVFRAQNQDSLLYYWTSWQSRDRVDSRAMAKFEKSEKMREMAKCDKMTNLTKSWISVQTQRGRGQKSMKSTCLCGPPNWNCTCIRRPRACMCESRVPVFSTQARDSQAHA